MAYPEKITYKEKYNLRPIVDPDGQFSAEDANQLKEKFNKNALFHGVYPNLSTLQTAFPDPQVGAFAYMLDGSHYKCVSVGWKKSPGISPYDLAVQNGYVGDLTSWLASLVGPQGPAGSDGSGTTASTEIISFSTNYQSGLTFSPASTFKENGTLKNDSRPITAAAADPTYDRFDLWAIDLTLDQIILIKGTASANPVTPDYDPLTQLPANIISVKAGAIAPENVVGITIYAEGGEWPTAGVAASIQYQNTESPASGIYAVKTTIPLNQGQVVPFTAPVPKTWEEGMEISYKLKNIVGGVYQWLIQGTDSKGRAKSLFINAPFNYSVSSTVYQPLSVVIPSGLASITKVSIYSVNNGLQFFLDDVKLVTGGGAVTGDYATVGYVDAKDAETLAAAKAYSDSLVIGGGSGNWKENEYLTITELLANQASQNAGKLQHILDASIDATVTTGWATYELLGAKTGVLGDYRKLSEKESMDVAAVGASTTEQTLTDASTLSWDLSTQQLAYLLATSAVGNTRTLPNSIIASGQDSGNYQLFFKQDATGGRIILFEDSFTVFGDFNLQANGVTVISLVTRGTDSVVVLTAEVATNAPQNLTGTELEMSQPLGNVYNIAAPSASLSYTTINPVINGNNSCFINAASEPIVYETDGTTPATKIAGATFVASTPMEMVVESKDGSTIRYFFLEL